MELKILHTNIFRKNLNAWESGYRYIVNQGGSRSSKTYSILQLIIYIALTKKTTISIVRQSLPSIKGSVMRDFFEIMKDLKIYNLNNHQKTENYYKFDNGSLVEFFPTIDDQKLRGRKRDILYINEANEIDFQQFNQLALRTTSSIFIDFNPSDMESYIYDLLEDTNKSLLIKSTYKDNIFLQKEQIDYIENLINVDRNYYLVYALGERPVSKTRIYTHFKNYTKLPDGDWDWWYGLDFGFNHPTALVKVFYVDAVYYVEEVIYQTGLTSVDLARLMEEKKIDKNKAIWADYSRPEIITDLRRRGFNVKDAVKDVKAGIDTVKSSEIYIHTSSVNLLREYKMYSWKTKGEEILDEPVKLSDDLCDALRYAIHSTKKSKFNPKAATIFKPRLKPDEEDW